MNYVVATIKRWHIEKFAEVKNSYPGNWFLITQKDALTYDWLDAIKPRYVFLPHWSWLIKSEIFEKFECVVFHSGYLPNDRGGSIFQYKIMSGETHLQMNAIKVNKGIDTGDVYMKRDLCLNGSVEEVYLRTADIIFDDMIPYIIENEPTPVPQTDKGTIFRRRNPDQSEIKVENLKDLHNFIRALDADTYPSAFIQSGKLKFEFTRSSLRTGYIEANVKIKEEL